MAAENLAKAANKPIDRAVVRAVNDLLGIRVSRRAVKAVARKAEAIGQVNRLTGTTITQATLTTITLAHSDGGEFAGTGSGFRQFASAQSNPELAGGRRRRLSGAAAVGQDRLH